MTSWELEKKITEFLREKVENVQTIGQHFVIEKEGKEVECLNR